MRGRGQVFLFLCPGPGGGGALQRGRTSVIAKKGKGSETERSERVREGQRCKGHVGLLDSGRARSSGHTMARGAQESWGRANDDTTSKGGREGKHKKDAKNR